MPKKTEYTKVTIGGRTVRVAKTLSAATNDRRGFCRKCSGNGSVAVPGQARNDVCKPCNGSGRA